MTLNVPELVLDTRDGQGDRLGTTYSQSPTPSRGHPVRHQETSRRPLSPQDPLASRSSHCANVEPGRVQTGTGLGTQGIDPYRSKRQQAHPWAERPIHATESWVLADGHFPPTQGHGRRALPYLPAATRFHWLPTPQAPAMRTPTQENGLRAFTAEFETKTGRLHTGPVVHSVCALGKQKKCLSHYPHHRSLNLDHL